MTYSREALGRLIERIDDQRTRAGFLTVQQVATLMERDNVVLDPFGLLIGAGVEVGAGNVFYPGVVVEARNGGTIRLGDRNILHPQTLVRAAAGRITIGDGNELGPGGMTISAGDQAAIAIGDTGRYNNGVLVVGATQLGSGSQVLGAITVQDSVLAAGGGYTHPDPDQRGGVLKGSGVARGIRVGQGEVINRRGMFEQEAIEWQRVYHPK